MSTKNKVVITGMGMISALGLNLETNWNNLIAGKSGVKKITLFDPSSLDTQIAAQVPDDFEHMAESLIPEIERKMMTRPTMMAVAAAKEAVSDSQINFNLFDRRRVSVIIGRMHSSYNDLEHDKSDAALIVKTMPSASNTWIANLYGIKGFNLNVSSACASSAFAIGMGFDMIRSNVADAVIVGGTDSHIYYERVKGFNRLLSLSIRNDSPETASRPFSKTRDGFVMGEGAGIMVLESEKSAKSRNARIYGEIAGYSIMSEAFHIVSPADDGIGMAKTMECGIKNAEIDKNDIDYVNAHGTSTYKNDKFETNAIKMVFKERTKDLPISSSKSMIGHTIGSAGILEGIITVMSMNQSLLTPTINYFDPDPELDLDYVPNKYRKHDIRAAISNSFGFGGHNACIIFKRA